MTASRNSVTGALQKTKPTTEESRDGWDAIFKPRREIQVEFSKIPIDSIFKLHEGVECKKLDEASCYVYVTGECLPIASTHLVYVREK